MFLYMCCLCILSYNSGPPQKYQTGTRAHGYLNPPPPPRVPVWDKGMWLPESPSPTQSTRLGQGMWLLYKILYNVCTHTLIHLLYSRSRRQ